MATATTEIIQFMRSFVINIWDWPDTPGSRLRELDRRRFRILSSYLSVIIGIAAAAFSVASINPVGETIGWSVAGVISGHYAAALLIQLTRRRRSRNRLREGLGRDSN